GALRDRSRAVFQGLIRVDKKAQRTNAYQANRNLVLGGEARADSFPKLEIEADDVRCTHGATVGQVDEEELFYLMTRGLDRQKAERLIIYGFFEQVLQRVPLEQVQRELRAAIERKLLGE
ncbi:MAG: SufD family Fe-S cluster assembly protein, partial [Deinococcus sp.]|nr:SufD family Fe-S cluster assembly protein [Deinococcus sp.]